MPWQEIRSRLLFLVIAWCEAMAHSEVMPWASIGREGYWILKDLISEADNEAAGFEAVSVDEIIKVSKHVPLRQI